MWSTCPVYASKRSAACLSPVFPGHKLRRFMMELNTRLQVSAEDSCWYEGRSERETCSSDATHIDQVGVGPKMWIHPQNQQHHIQP